MNIMTVEVVSTARNEHIQRMLPWESVKFSSLKAVRMRELQVQSFQHDAEFRYREFLRCFVLVCILTTVNATVCSCCYCLLLLLLLLCFSDPFTH